MRDLWDTIEARLEPEVLRSLRPGASDKDIATAEARLEVAFPEDLRASYRIHDGQQEDGPGLIQGWEFLSLARMLEEWTAWNDLLVSGDVETFIVEPDPEVRATWWNRRWIPLASSGAGDEYCLDLDPTPAGTTGQMIAVWHDWERRSLEAADFRSWLAANATGPEDE